jgi:hypothetical protein
MSKEKKNPEDKTKAGKIIKAVKDAVVGAPSEIVTETKTESGSHSGSEPTDFVVTITLNIGGRTQNFTYRGKSEEEVMAKIKRAKRSINWFGSVLMRVLVRNEKVNQKLIGKIEKILKATEEE